MSSEGLIIFLLGIILVYIQGNNIVESQSSEEDYKESGEPAYDTSFNYSDTNVNSGSEETTTIPSFLDLDIRLKPTANLSSIEPVPYVEEISARAKSVDEQIEELVRLYAERKQKEQLELSEITQLLQRVAGLNSKLNDFESYLDGLKNDASRFGSGLPISGLSPGSPSPFTSSRMHSAWATFYRYTGHSGGSTIVDFRQCSRSETCCKNLEQYDNDTQSIHTHDTCVQVFKDSNCSGDSRIYKPGSYDHSDLGSFKDSISSAKPCYD